MECSWFGVYLKWNLLLGAAYVLWVVTRQCAVLSGQGVNHRQQLRIARGLFLSLLLFAPLMSILQVLLPTVATLPDRIVGGNMLIGGNVDQGLAYPLQLGENTFAFSDAVLVLLLAGLAVRVCKLIRQVSYLRHILEQSTEWKHLGQVRLLFSPTLATPFSTRALGRSQIVLPFDLMKTPRHLRLVVKHELQHLRNGDLDWILLVEAIKVLCFWNPAIHCWHHEFDCLQEFACDEALLDKGSVNAQDYGHCLLDIASVGPGEPVIAASTMVPCYSLLLSPHSQLKRRIHMLGHYKSARPSFVKALGHVVLAGGGLMLASLLVFGAEAPPPRPIPEGLSEFVYYPEATTPPRYPQRALDEKLEGWVLVSLMVDAGGKVANAVVIDGCVAQGSMPCMPDNDVFYANTLAAVQDFTFEPRIENGEPVATPGVRYVFRFSLGNEG